MKRGIALIAAGLLAAAPGFAEVVRVNLKDADPQAVSRELESALRAPVEVQGAKGRSITLDLATASPALTLDRVAALLRGTWSMKLRVRRGMPGTEPSPSPRPLLERNLSIGIRDLPVERAFALVARELRADLEVEGELDARVTLSPESLPVGVLLDRLCEQSSAAWSVRYVLNAPDAPPVPEPLEPNIRIVPEPVRPKPRTALVRIVPPQPLSASALKQGLWADVNDLVRASPDVRGEALKQFLDTAEKRIATLAPLSPAERAARLRAAKPVITQWRRLYAGLSPSLRRELRPAAELLEKHLGGV